MGAVLYVSKFPPSSSGVALYATVFEQVLARLGPVRRVSAPSDPVDSQRLGAAVRGYWLGLRAARSGVEHVQVELSGRALFELYFCAGLLRRRRRPSLSVTCHDLPSIVGGSCLFTLLDVRGLRRVGMALSRSIGARTERRVLSRAEAVFALTRSGAEYLSNRTGRAAHRLGHVVDEPAAVSKDRAIFVPGPVGHALARELDDVIAAAIAAAPDGGRWSVLVGRCDEDTARLLRSRSGDRIDIHLVGYVSEADLLDMFSRAALVVRLTGGYDGGNSMAASGPLSWAVSRGCVCVTDDARAGARELEQLGLIALVPDPARALREVLATWESQPNASEIAGRAQHEMGVHAVSDRFRRALRK